MAVPRPLRILHVFRSPVGGIFRHVRDLAAAQAAEGHSVGIVCDSSTGGAHEDRLFEAIGPSLALGLYRTPMPRQPSLADLFVLVRLFRRIRALQPDVIHTHGAKGGAYGRMIGTLLRASGSSVVRIYCPHGGSLHYDPASVQGRVFFAMERWMERFTDRLVFVSRYEAEAYAEKVGAPSVPFDVVPNGLQRDEFDPVEAEPGAADFLYIGMMRDLKGPDIFIEALASLRDRIGAAPRAEIVGDGADKPRYVERVRNLGLDATTRFHDAMPARVAFAKASTIVVPSRAESMPYIVLEAIAAGRPMVATKVGGVPEIFGPSSDRLVAPGDVVALAEAMAAMLDDPQTAARDAGHLRDLIRPRFSVEAMTRAIDRVYQEAFRP